ncbi:MAG: chloride channel protein [Microthrixaceae bacterium]
MDDLAVAALVAVVGVMVAALFAAAVTLLRRALTPVPVSVRYVLGGAALGVLGLWSPYALTFGETQLESVLDPRVAVGVVAVAALAKFIGTTVTLAAGWKGGFIIPLFFIGASLGQVAHAAMPWADGTVLTACAMVAICVAVTKTPVGTTLVVTEMAGLSLLPVTIVAAVVAVVLSARVSLIDTQRGRSVPDTGNDAASDHAPGDAT